MDTTSLKKYFFAGAAASLAVIVVVWQVGYDTGAKSISAQITQSQSPAEVKSVVGKIVNISGATLTVITTASTGSVRDVTTDSNTVFERVIRKNPKTLQSDMLAFNKRIKTATTSDTPLQFPLPFTFKKISLTDLRVGDIVVVTAAEDILTKSQFTATRVSVQSPP